MNNLSHLGLISCFLFAIVLNGASESSSGDNRQSKAYIVNNSHDTIYFKPESRRANAGLDPYSAYALAPGESYYLPFDAIVTNEISPGKIFRLPTGSTVQINNNGAVEPSNIIARAGILFAGYGEVNSPCVQFAKLANPKKCLARPADIKR
jgi:hypothetical protein